MKLYNFKRLIDKYSVSFSLCRQEEGKYVAGKWENGQTVQSELRGAIVPLRESKIYTSGGAYSEQDRELYLTAPLPAPLSSLSVIYKGNTYSVEDSRNFEDYADVAVYTLKWVSKK